MCVVYGEREREREREREGNGTICRGLEIMDTNGNMSFVLRKSMRSRDVSQMDLPSVQPIAILTLNSVKLSKK